MKPDFLVIGAGVAGLRAAIELVEAGSVLVVAKETLHESSSEYAQGGIAVALSDDDEAELHEQDTLYAGNGLCDRAAVRAAIRNAPQVALLIARCDLVREESRGSDFPLNRPEFEKHSLISKDSGVRFE